MTYDLAKKIAEVHDRLDAFARKYNRASHIDRIDFMNWLGYSAQHR